MAYFKASKNNTLGDIPSFSQATDEEITKALEYHRRGLIDLTKYWAVGDERPIHLNAMEALSPLTDTHVAQDNALVILDNRELFNLSDSEGGGKNIFIIGLKYSLLEKGTPGGISGSESNTTFWKDTIRRTWCDEVFREALPTEVKKWFKKFKYKSNYSNDYTFFIESENYFVLPFWEDTTNCTTSSIAYYDKNRIPFTYYTNSNYNLPISLIDGTTNISFWCPTSIFNNRKQTINYHYRNRIGGGSTNNDNTYYLALYGVV